MSRIMKTLIREVRLGNVHADNWPEVVLRLWGDPHADNGRMYWIDWAVYDVTGYTLNTDGSKGPKTYERKGATSSHDTVEDLDEAQPLAEGMVKWDGCTQFTADIHVDNREHLDLILECIQDARRFAAELMVDTYDQRSEYE